MELDDLVALTSADIDNKHGISVLVQFLMTELLLRRVGVEPLRCIACSSYGHLLVKGLLLFWRILHVLEEIHVKGVV